MWVVAAAPSGGEHNSYSVCSIWLIKPPNYYLIHMERGRFDFPDLLKKAKELADRYKPSEVLVEDASTGIVLAQELPKILQAPVKAVRVERDKVTRLYQHQPKFEAGRVHLPKGASFLSEFEEELFAFPNGKHDDQVDSLTQALSHQIKTHDASMEGFTRFYEGMLFEHRLRMMSQMKR